MTAPQNTTTTITSGTTTGEILLKGKLLVGVWIPSGVASTTMKISTAPSSGGTFVNAIDGLGQLGTAGSDVTFTIAASKYVPIPPFLTAGIPVCKLVFGSSETSKTYDVAFKEVG